MDSVVHFEMPYDDRKRMAKFYESAFGWRTQMLGQEMEKEKQAFGKSRKAAGGK